MYRKYFILGFVILNMILGGFIGGISISSAFGSTGNASGGIILACYNSTPGNGSVKLNGHQIGNSGLLSVPGENCASGDTSLGLASYRRTILVSPNGTPAQNGTALLAAVTTASSSNPSASNGFLIKLEPGVYDLGNQSLVMHPYVDLEGSGEGITTITSQVTSAPDAAFTGTLKAASNSEVRLITLANTGTNLFLSRAAEADQVDATARFTHVSFKAPNGVALGISQGGTPLIQNSTIDGFTGVSNNGSGAVIKDTTIKAVLTGISNGQTSLTLDNINLTVTCPAGATGMPDTTGIVGSKGSLTLLNSTLNVQGCQNSTVISSGYSFNVIMQNTIINGGVNDVNGTVTGVSATAGSSGVDIKGSTIKVVSNNSSTAVKVSSATVFVKNSTLVALDGVLVDTNGVVSIQNSTIKGTANSIRVSTGNSAFISAGSSQLDGPVTGTATFKCIFTYKGDYTATNSSCQ